MRVRSVPKEELKTVSIARGAKAGRRLIVSLGCIALSMAAFTSVSSVARAGATPPAHASTQLYGVHPAEQGSTTLPGGHFNYALVPGQRVEDGIVVENLSSRALSFNVYGADLITAIGGGLAPAQPTTVMRGVGAWITVSAPTVTIAAHDQFTDDFAVTLPADITPGQHLGAVVVAADVGLTSQGTPIETRAALITVVTVPGTAHTAATLTPLRGSTDASGDIRLGITLFNSGNVLLTYVAVIDIMNGDGDRVAQLVLTPAGAYVVPSGQVPLAAVWKDTASLSGQYRAQATVSILADGTPVGTLRSRSLTLELSSGFPAVILAGAALALMLIVVIVVRSLGRGMRRRRAHDDWSVSHGRRLGSLR